MIDFPLQLRLREGEPASPADAWLLPGTDQRTWLRWLCQHVDRDLDSMTLLVIPSSASNVQPAGLFVISRLAVDAPHQGRALPFTLIGNRLFVPADAELRYPLTDNETAAAFLSDFNILHPSVGLISGDREDTITAADLLTRPKPRETLWNCADPGTLPEPERLSISAVVSWSTPQELVDEGKEDISDRDAKELSSLKGNQNPGTVSRGVTAMRDAFYRGIVALTSRLPEGADQETWVNRLEDWAAGNLSDLVRHRKNAIDRLVELLGRDPDQGLQYAIPIGGENSHRGRAKPGADLGRQKVDFDLNNLAVSGPVDGWDLRWDQIEQLSGLYREAANRELTLGRYRRAAFIFARLLNDYRSAADALKSGKHFREAAALYQDKLAARESAAECLRECGLYEEAAKLYAELELFEELGDMYVELGRDTDAAEAFEQAVEFSRNRHETLAAARVIDDKLSDPGRARDLLRADWPGGRGARASLNEYFNLLSRDQEHQEALTAIGQLSAMAGSLQQKFALAQVVSGVADSYPQDEVVSEASDATRVLLGEYLQTSTANLDSAAKMIRSLDRGDRLLHRDAGHFVKGRTGVTREPAVPAVSPDNAPVEIISVRSDQLAVGFKLAKAIDSPLGLLLIGSRSGKPCVRIHRNDQEVVWDQAIDWQVVDAVVAGHDGPMYSHQLCIRTSEELSGKLVESDDGSIWISTSSDRSVALDPAGRIHEFQLAEDGGILRRLSGESIEETHRVPLAELGNENRWTREGAIPLVRATGKAAYIAMHNHLIRFAHGQSEVVEIPAPALGILEAPMHTQRRIMFNMEFGAGLLRDDESRWSKVRYFASDMAFPKVQFMRTGHVLAANSERLRVYVVGKYEISKVGEIKGINDRVVDILPGPNVAEFQILTERRLLTYRILKR